MRLRVEDSSDREFVSETTDEERGFPPQALVTEGLFHAQHARIGSRDDDSERRRAERRHKDTLASRGYCLLQADDGTALFDCDEG